MSALGRRWRALGAGIRGAVIAATVVLVLAAVVLTAWFSPLLSVREVRVTGLDLIDHDEVTAVLGEVEGTPLLRMDTTAAANRIAGIARVAQVRVRTDYPSTLRVEVTERVPVAFIETEDGPHLIDVEGIDFAAQEPPMFTPRLDPDPQAGPEELRTALAVIDELPPVVGDQLESVGVDDRGGLEFRLSEDRVLRWGPPTETALKGEVAQAVLTQPGRVYDVTVPSLPTVE